MQQNPGGIDDPLVGGADQQLELRQDLGLEGGQDLVERILGYLAGGDPLPKPVDDTLARGCARSPAVPFNGLLDAWQVEQAVNCRDAPVQCCHGGHSIAMPREPVMQRVTSEGWAWS